MTTAALQKYPDKSSDADSLQRLNAEYIDAVNQNNVRWFEVQLAPDFMNSSPDGTLVDRKSFIDQVARGAGVSDIQALDVIVRIVDDLGIVHARTTYQLPSGKPGSGRYTDIWSRRGDRWVCVAAHVSRG